MNKIILLLGFVAGAAGLFAGERIAVTPTSLADWTVVGAEKSELARAPVLRLPPGAQLARTFSADRVVVQLNTAVSLGGTLDDLPTLEAGSAGIAFVGDVSGGKMILVIGDGAAITLPYAIKPTGEPGFGQVDVALVFDGAAGRVGVANGGETRWYAAEKSVAAIDVVVSAGTQAELPLANLDVEWDSSSDLLNVGRSIKGADDYSDRPVVRGLKQKKSSSDIAGVPSDPSVTASTSKSDQKRTGGAPLEIFTPPSIHRGRVAAVRAAVQALRVTDGRVTP